MSLKRHTFSILVSIMLLAGTAAAQGAGGQTPARAGAAATASDDSAGVRFVSPEGARRVRLEVYTASGERLFDSGFRAGSIADWNASGVADGSYLCILTAEDLSGGLGRSLSGVTLKGGRAAVRREGEGQLKAEFAQALAAAGQVFGGVDAAGGEQAATVAAHDGTDGQVTSTSGALTFRTGDVFSGKEREQMRVTPEGRVGIGTNAPEDTLDVAGTIRARGGIRFDDGTVLTSAKQAQRAAGVTSISTSAAGDTIPGPSVAGTGTTNTIAKWSNATGSLADSTFLEDTSGNVFNFFGSRVVAPGQQPFFEMQRGNSGDIMQRFWNTGTGGAKLRYVAGTGSTSQVQFTDNMEWISSVVSNNQIGLQFRVRTAANANSEAGLDSAARLTIARNGNVGVGTTAPNSKLEVAGDLRVSGTGSGIIFADGSKMTTAPGGAGSTPSGTSIISAINDPAATGVINDNRHSPNMARLNGANAWSGSNVFGAGLSANNALITNVGNPVNAGDAVNKAYVDANAGNNVKFVPGAEQLSVGDANGTAPMINLRGGSTCCSGPGGHTPAWFKVFQNGSFVATGNLGIGVSPMQGKGYRTSWDSLQGRVPLRLRRQRMGRRERRLLLVGGRLELDRHRPLRARLRRHELGREHLVHRLRQRQPGEGRRGLLGGRGQPRVRHLRRGARQQRQVGRPAHQRQVRPRHLQPPRPRGSRHRLQRDGRPGSHDGDGQVRLEQRLPGHLHLVGRRGDGLGRHVPQHGEQRVRGARHGRLPLPHQPRRHDGLQPARRLRRLQLHFEPHDEGELLARRRRRRAGAAPQGAGLDLELHLGGRERAPPRADGRRLLLGLRARHRATRPSACRTSRA